MLSNFVTSALLSAVTSAATSAYSSNGAPLMFSSNFTYMATSTVRYEFESDDATYIKTDNMVSMTMPNGFKTDEISDVFSCLARNPGNNL